MEPRFGGLAQMMGTWLGAEIAGLRVAAVPVTDPGTVLPDPAAFDGFVITGSRASAYDPEPWIPRLEAYLRALHGQGRPVLGICFGHQILAQALGGRVAHRGWRVGLERIEAPALAGPKPVAAHVWHQDQVVALPPGARVAAAYAGCPVGALDYGPSALSLQWHPEYPPDYMAEVLAAEGPASLPPGILASASASLTGAHDGARVAHLAAAHLGWR